MHSMKRYCTFALLIVAALLFADPTYAQMGGFPGGGQGGGRQMPKMGKMYGKVVDGKSGKPLDMASVSLLQTKDGKKVLVQGGLTAANGEFSLENLPMMG